MGVKYILEDRKCPVCGNVPISDCNQPDICNGCAAKGYIRNPKGPKGFLDFLFRWKPFIKVK
jgi:hypothetical protein